MPVEGPLMPLISKAEFALVLLIFVATAAQFIVSRRYLRRIYKLTQRNIERD